MYNCFFASLLSLLLIACGHSGVTADTVAITSEGWQLEDPAIFELPRLDSLATYNAFITVRNNNKYPFSNLFLIVSLQHPYGKTVVDTLEYKMARPDGSWLGTGIGSVKENKLFFKQNLAFNEAGNYTLHISHAVRNNGEPQGVRKLEGITDIGYSLETVK
ncbi:MAG: gliding motility lipoprotein GldH [Patiriisocius sp.]|jgi:gliding motility-associated lipoprotein GldH|tara:strand:+ start:617 stop:1099 length:483 start_codon:yes stop_codon:yes gene_type:complete